MGGLMDYKARFYSPYLNHFTQPDTIIPDPSNPQAWNRFSYVTNRPISYNDPSGHCFSGVVVDTIACVNVAIIAGLAIFAVATVYVIITPREQIERDMQTVGNAMDRALQANKPPYVSKRSLDKVDTMETLISDTNSGNRYPNLFDKCFKSVKNFIGCGSIVALFRLTEVA